MADEDYCTDCQRNTVVVLDRASGDTVCTECGLVLESRVIDDTAEWRNFADDSGDHDPNRVGSAVNPILGDVALSTVVSGGSTPGLSRVMNRRQPDPNGAVLFAFGTIAEMADRLSLLATIKDRACELYKRLLVHNSNRGKKMESLAAACIFFACKEEGKSRTIKEICSALNGSTKKEFIRAIDFIRKTLNAEVREPIKPTTANASDYLRRFCSKLGMSHEMIRTVEETIQKSEELYIRRSPTTIAAAVIFMINQLSGSKVSLKEIAAATTVAEGTIKSACKDLYPYVQRILPERYVNGRDLRNLDRLKF